MSQTSLLALVELYDQTVAATATLDAAACTARERIARARAEQIAKDRNVVELDVYEVLLDALGIIEFAVDSENWKTALVVPMLKTLHGRILGVLNKTRQSGGSIQ